MATSIDTTNPSRRLFLAAGSAATVFGALAAAAADESPLSQAIARHKEVRAMVDGETETADEDRMAALCRDEFRAVEAVARAPVSSDAEAMRKLKHLFDFEIKLYGGMPGMNDHLGSIMIALAAQFETLSA